MELSGHTKPFAVLGHPIGHTLSPCMHNAAMRALGMDAVYLAFDVHPSRLMKVLPAMADMGFGGVNLTVPLKEVAFRGLKKLDKLARVLGAVNTVRMEDSGLTGYNTDGRGFLRAIREEFNIKPRGLSMFVLGAGGAGRAVAITCALEGAGKIVLADIMAARARSVAQEIRRLAPGVKVEALPADPAAWRYPCAEAELVVQATPVGMKKGDKSLLAPSSFSRGQAMFDLVYMFPQTATMKAAAKAGARQANGLGMLLHQGAEAFRIWTGVEPPVAVMRRALEDAVYGRKGKQR